MGRRDTWRAQFNEGELALIDAATPASLMGRMAKLLDEQEARLQVPPNVKHFNEERTEEKS